MFTVQVKTNRQWILSNIQLSEGSWTEVPKKKFANLKDAEIQLSYLQQQFQNLEDIKNLEVDYRILDKDSRVMFEKRHVLGR